jgi:sensor histidine kinase YesM
MTLNNSSRSFVSLAEEADYLSSYLLLEKMRFEDKIDYELVIEKTIDPATVLLPPMLVQPFVENALHHGLQHKTSGKGLVSIKVQREKEHLMIIITDNGIGRKAAAIRKKTGLKEYLKEYTSKGVTLTEDRIEIMNKLYKRTTSVEISDVLDDKNAPIGTSVIVLLPFFQEQDLYS